MLLENSLLELTLLDRAWGQRHTHHRGANRAGSIGPWADGTREQRLGLNGENSGGWKLEWNLRSRGLRRTWGRGQGSEFPLELTAVLTAQEAEGQERSLGQ